MPSAWSPSLALLRELLDPLRDDPLVWPDGAEDESPPLSRRTRNRRGCFTELVTFAHRIATNRNRMRPAREDSLIFSPPSKLDSRRQTDRQNVFDHFCVINEFLASYRIPPPKSVTRTERVPPCSPAIIARPELFATPRDPSLTSMSTVHFKNFQTSGSDINKPGTSRDTTMSSSVLSKPRETRASSDIWGENFAPIVVAQDKKGEPHYNNFDNRLYRSSTSNQSSSPPSAPRSPELHSEPACPLTARGTEWYAELLEDDGMPPGPYFQGHFDCSFSALSFGDLPSKMPQSAPFDPKTSVTLPGSIFPVNLFSSYQANGFAEINSKECIM